MATFLLYIFHYQYFIIIILTAQSFYDTMRPLHKTNIDDEKSLVPKEGEREVLCSNKACPRSPSLGLDQNNIPKEVLIDQFAKIIVDYYFWKKRNGTNT
ncbi:MAG: hypothetical protein JWP69_561 [Flaviaesturariibacter sp.]|nr:hypothetical protein [Flaviaesturariibacter sp.]